MSGNDLLVGFEAAIGGGALAYVLHVETVILRYLKSTYDPLALSEAPMTRIRF